jgi:[ribosomal protein S5]-alanine N-acetyltransferase
MPAYAPTVAVRSTSRLQLRAVADADVAFLTALFARPEIVAHRPRPVPDLPADVEARVANDIAHWRDHGFGKWAIADAQGVIGIGGWTQPPSLNELHISYHMRPESWGQGFASEFVADAVDVALHVLHAQRLVGRVRPVNVASQRVLERAGFVFEGLEELHGAPTRRFVRVAVPMSL